MGVDVDGQSGLIFFPGVEPQAKTPAPVGWVREKNGGSSRQKGKEYPKSGSLVNPCSHCSAPHRVGGQWVLCA